MVSKGIAEWLVTIEIPRIESNQGHLATFARINSADFSSLYRHLLLVSASKPILIMIPINRPINLPIELSVDH